MIRRRKPIARESPRRRAERALRRQVIDLVGARDGRHCNAATLVPEITCRGRLDADEICPRGVYPGGHLDPDNVQLLCRAHHEWKTHNALAAEQLGLRRWSWQ